MHPSLSRFSARSTFSLWSIDSSSVWSGQQRSRILIIDDDQGLSRVLAMTLRVSGFDPAIANDGDAGLDLLRSQPYDAVVLDMRMPGKDGRAVYREMRKEGIEAPVLVLSAYDARQAYEDLGCQAYLNKPFEPDRLIRELYSLLGR